MDTTSTTRLLITLLFLPLLAFGQNTSITVDKNGNVKGPKSSNFITGQSDLKVDGIAVLPGGGGGGGGGGLAGGSPGQFQWNNAGLFDGSSDLTLAGGQINAIAADFLFIDISDSTKRFFFSLANVPSGVTEGIVVANALNPVIPAPYSGGTNQFVTSLGAGGILGHAQVTFPNVGGALDPSQTSIINQTLMGRNASGNGPYQSIRLGTNLSWGGSDGLQINATGGGGVATVPINRSLYVDQVNGLDPPAGAVPYRLDKPYQTVHAALTDSISGDVVYVGPGTYTETGFTVPSGVSVIGAGASATIITSNLSDATHAVMRWGDNTFVSDLAVQSTGTSPPIGILSGDTTASGAFFMGVNTIGVTDGFKVDHAGTNGFTAIDCTTTATGTGSGSVTGVDSFSGTNNVILENCEFNSTGAGGSGNSSPRGISVTTGTVKAYYNRINIANSGASGNNIGVRVAGGTAEIHGLVVNRDATGSGVKADLNQTTGTLNVENVSRPDGAALVTVGTIGQLSRYALRDNNLSDLTNLGTARTNLGLAIGTNVQAWDADLDIWATKTAPAGAVVGTTDTQRLTSKNITKRRLDAPVPGPTPAFNTDNYDVLHFSGMTADVTSMTSGMTGTPNPGDSLRMDFTDDGTSRAIAWGAGFEASPGQILPIATTASTRMDVGFIWNTVTSKWRCVASTNPSSGSANFGTVAVAGQSNITATSVADLLNVAAGTNVTLTTNSGTKTLTIASTGGGGGGSGTVTSVGLTGTANQITVTGTSPITTSGTFALSIPALARLSVGKLTNLTTDGFVKTSGSDGSLSIDTTTYSGTPTGTGFYHTTSGVMDPAAVTETGTGNVVRDTGSTQIGPTFVEASNAALTNVIYGYRFTDTSPVSTGSLMKFDNAAQDTDLWRVDLTGTLLAGSIPLARVTGLGTGVASALTVAVGGAGAFVTFNGAGGTPSSITLTNANSLPLSAVTGSTSQPLVVGSLELGSFTDTTLARASAGRVTVEGVRVQLAAPRVDDQNVPTSPYAPDSDTYDLSVLRAIGAALTINAPTGTPAQGQRLGMRFKDDGTARALTFQTGSSGQYRFSSDMAAPTTTVLSKTLYMLFIYNSTDSRWDNVAQMNNF